MQPIDPDHVLRELADVDERVEGEAPSNAELDAYRGGALTEAAAEAVEARVVLTSGARQWLRARARHASPRAPRWIRRAVLAPFEGAPPRRRYRWPIGLAAAALLAITVGIQLLPPPALPADVTFSVEASSLATVRGASQAGDGVEVDRNSVVTIEIRPIERSVADVAFAIYHRVGDRLTRLDNLEQATHRGAASFRVAARRVAPERGQTEIWVVAARPGDLPEDLALRPGEAPPQRLGADGRRRVYPVRLVAHGPEGP